MKKNQPSHYILKDIVKGARMMDGYLRDRGIKRPNLSSALAALDNAERRGYTSWANYEILRDAADDMAEIIANRAHPGNEVRAIHPPTMTKQPRPISLPWHKERGANRRII